MEVTVVSNDYVGLVEVCRRMRGKDVNARRVTGGNAAVVLSEFIDVDRRNFEFQLLDVVDKEALLGLFAENEFEHVVHLAAQAGVRYSIDHPDNYAQSNLVGFLNMLEACRAKPARKARFTTSALARR